MTHEIITIKLETSPCTGSKFHPVEQILRSVPALKVSIIAGFRPELLLSPQHTITVKISQSFIIQDLASRQGQVTLYEVVILEHKEARPASPVKTLTNEYSETRLLARTPRPLT